MDKIPFLSMGSLAPMWLSGRWSEPAEVAVGGLGILAGAVLLRRGWARLFGPVLFYELIRTARRGRHVLVRAIYLVLLLLVLLYSYRSAFPAAAAISMFTPVNYPGPMLAEFAASFFYVFLALQLQVIFWLTPAYTAGAIAQEKERHTLESLLVTDLRSREIVLSMYVSRLANLSLIVLAGLPVLCLVQFMGGVDPMLLLASFAVLGLSLASLAALGVFNSVTASKAREAIGRTYIMAFAYLFFSGLTWALLVPPLSLADFPSTDNWASPVTIQDMVEWINGGNIMSAFGLLVHGLNTGGKLSDLLPSLLTKYAWFHGLAALGFCAGATLRLRSEAVKMGNAPQTTRGGRRSRAAWRGLGLVGRPGVWDWPLLWKEIAVDVGGRRGLIGWFIVGILIAILFFPAIHIIAFFGRLFPAGPDDPLREILNIWVRLVSALLAAMTLMDLAMRAAGSIGSERDRGTLEGLLATPLENRAILGAKWLGSVFHPRWTWVILCLIWLVGYLGGALHPLALPFFLLAWMVFAAFMTGLGLWFSVASRTTHRAVLWTAAALGGLLVGSIWFAYRLTQAGLPPAEAYRLIPPVTLFVAPFFSNDSGPLAQLEVRKSALLLGLVPWAVVAVALCLVANARFRKTCGRNSLRAVPRNPDCAADAQVSLLPTSTNDKSLLSLEENPGKVSAANPGKSPASSVWPEASPNDPLFRSRVSVWPRRYAPTVLALVPLCLLLGWYGCVMYQSARSLRQAVAAADRLDPGWRLEQLEENLPSVPEDENAAAHVQDAYKMLPERWTDILVDQELQEHDPVKQFTPEQIRFLTKELELTKPALIEARRLKDMQKGQARIAPGQPWWSSFAINPLRHVAYLLRHDSLLQAQKNHGDGALDSCRAMVNAARTVGEGSLANFVRDRLAMREIALAVIERILAQTQPRDQSLSALQRLLEEEDRQHLLRVWLRAQRAYLDAGLQAFQNGNVGFADGAYPSGALIPLGTLPRQRAILLRFLTELIEIAKLPEGEQEPKYQQIQENLGNEPMVIRLAVPTIINDISAHRQSEADLHCAIVALAVERYRLANRRWPDSLSDLTPSILGKVPVDPFDGQPLRYRRTADGVAIYSIGPDGIDDGGTLDPKKNFGFGTDIGIQLWDVPKRRQPPPAAATKK